MSMISIEGMEFYSHHGCFEEEQIIGTRFIVDLYFELDTSRAELSDNLDDTVNYQNVYQMISREMEKKSYLLEHVARRILEVVAEGFPEIEQAEVKISKLNPPLGGGKVQSVNVTLSTLDIQK